MTSDDDARWCKDQLKKFVGYEIVSICEDPENNSYGLVIERSDDIDAAALGANRTLLWIDCDPEGNGPGFVSIEENA